jgi:hypothetical protein
LITTDWSYLSAIYMTVYRFQSKKQSCIYSSLCFIYNHCWCSQFELVVISFLHWKIRNHSSNIKSCFMLKSKQDINDHLIETFNLSEVNTTTNRWLMKSKHTHTHTHMPAYVHTAWKKLHFFMHLCTMLHVNYMHCCR